MQLQIPGICGARMRPMGPIPICICGGSAICAMGIGIIIPAGKWPIGRPICPLLTVLTGDATEAGGVDADA